jgi:hypothetical protein
MYRVVHERFWSDPAVRKLSAEGKLLLLCLITNENSHVSGIYHISPAIISDHSGLPVKVVKKELPALEKGNLAYYDYETLVVFVRSMLRIQGPSSTVDVAVNRHLKSLHNSRLIPLFIQEYQDRNIFYEYRPNTVSIPYGEGAGTLTNPNPNPNTDTDLNTGNSTASNGTDAEPRNKKLTPSHDRTILEYELSKIDLSPYRSKYSPQGLDVDMAWDDFQDYVLNGDAKKPYPNPANWIQLGRAFHDSCKRDIAAGRNMRKGAERLQNQKEDHPIVVFDVKKHQREKEERLRNRGKVEEVPF